MKMSKPYITFNGNIQTHNENSGYENYRSLSLAKHGRVYKVIRKDAYRLPCTSNFTDYRDAIQAFCARYKALSHA